MFGDFPVFPAVVTNDVVVCVVGWPIAPDVPVGVEVSDRNALVMTSIGVLAVVSSAVAIDVVVCLGCSSREFSCWVDEPFIEFVSVSKWVALPMPKIYTAAALVTSSVNVYSRWIHLIKKQSYPIFTVNFIKHVYLEKISKHTTSVAPIFRF